MNQLFARRWFHMPGISRRKFIKSIGLCTALTALGNIHEGVSFVPSLSDPGRHLTTSETCTYPGAKYLYLGIGDPGIRVGRLLLAKTQTMNITGESLLPIQQFSPENHRINELMASADFVFLVGSVDDRDFWIGRDLILGHNVFFLYTVITDSGNSGHPVTGVRSDKNEGCIWNPGTNHEQSAALSVYSLFSMLMMPGMVCIDGSDIKSTMAGQQGVMIHTAASYKESPDVFKNTVSMWNQAVGQNITIAFKMNRAILIDFPVNAV